MRWEKLGLVYCASGEYEWAKSHAYVPTSMMRDESCIRVYAAFLDREKIGRIGFVDLDADDPRHILRVSEKCVLDIGQPGTFDDSGVTPVWLLSLRKHLYLYYFGWQMGVKARYYLFTGLAVSHDGGESFCRVSEAPILDRKDGELFVRSAANVLRDADKWQMWYVAGSGWIEVDGEQRPTYNMRYLESDDHAIWNKKGDVCLELADADEFGFGRPYVVKEDGVFKMWYSIRTISKGYRLGYAESVDGLRWERKDEEVGIDVSESGWDSEMIGFSCIQKTRSGTYMFYNGNNHGETGFGVARLQS